MGISHLTMEPITLVWGLLLAEALQAKVWQPSAADALTLDLLNIVNHRVAGLHVSHLVQLPPQIGALQLYGSMT